MKNFQNRREYEKMINTGKSRVYNSFPSVYHPLNSREWDGELQVVDEDLRAKKSREKLSEVQVHAPRSSGLHAMHFRRICFAVEAERMIPPFSELLENG